MYDGDGNRLLKIEKKPDPVNDDKEFTTVYIGQIYEELFDTTTESYVYAINTAQPEALALWYKEMPLQRSKGLASPLVNTVLPLATSHVMVSTLAVPPLDQQAEQDVTIVTPPSDASQLTSTGLSPAFQASTPLVTDPANDLVAPAIEVAPGEDVHLLVYMRNVETNWHVESLSPPFGDIIGQMLDGQGNKVGTPFTLVTSTPGVVQNYIPHISYNSYSKKFLVSWSIWDSSSTPQHIAYTLIGLDGTVGSIQHVNYNPDYTGGDAEWLVVSSPNPVDGSWMIFWQGSCIPPGATWWKFCGLSLLVDAQGNPMGSPFLVTPYGSSGADMITPEITFDTTRQRWFVVWSKNPHGFPKDVYARIVNPDKSILPSDINAPFSIGTILSGNDTPAAVYDPIKDEFLVLFTVNDTGWHLVHKRVSPDGALLPAGSGETFTALPTFGIQASSWPQSLDILPWAGEYLVSYLSVREGGVWYAGPYDVRYFKLENQVDDSVNWTDEGILSDPTITNSFDGTSFDVALNKNGVGYAVWSDRRNGTSDIFIRQHNLTTDLVAPPAPVGLANSTCGTHAVWQNSYHTPTFSWDPVVDAISGLEGYYIYWGDDPTGEDTSTPHSNVLGRWDNNFVLPDGFYDITIQATDRAGNVGLTVVSTLAIDNLAPTGLTINVPGSAKPTFSISWSAIDNESGIHSYDVAYKDVTDTNWSTLFNDTSQIEAKFTGEFDHAYLFRVRAKDKAGNETTWLESSPVLIDLKVRKYYNFNGQRLAMREGQKVYYLHGDHLGSTSLTTDSTGGIISEARYLPYGQVRWSNGTSVTDFGFTSQRNEASFGLLDYNARYYSAVLGRFVSPDTIVPDPLSSGGFNRYRYTRNNPLRYTDPSGHCEIICIITIGAMAVGMALMVSTDQAINDDIVVAEAAAGRTDYRDTYPAHGQGMIGGGLLLAPLITGALPSTTATSTGGSVAASACADGDCTNELNTAINIGNKTIEATTRLSKISSQLQSKADLLSIKVSGNMQSLNNPVVQQGLAKLNNITTNADRIVKTFWKNQPAYEYIKDGIGVLRDQATGEVLTVLNRTGVDLDKVEKMIENGTAEWLK